MHDKIFDVNVGEKFNRDYFWNEPPVDVASFYKKTPLLNRPVVEGFLRERETMNIIVPPFCEMSYLVSDLAISLAACEKWLQVFRCGSGRVLTVDFDMYDDAILFQMRSILEARRIGFENVRKRLFFKSMRGELTDTPDMVEWLKSFRPDGYDVVIINGLERFLRKDDCGTVVWLYNLLNGYSEKSGCTFVLAQQDSDLGDVCETMASAADTHVMLREYDRKSHAAVLEAEARSWELLGYVRLNWKFPLWIADCEINVENFEEIR